MKRFQKSDWLFVVLALALVLGVTAVIAKDFYWCNEIDDGSARSLDAISVSDIAHRDIAIVNQTESGESVFMIFEFNANSTLSSTTASHPYRIRPLDYVDKGVWHEMKAVHASGSGGGGTSGNTLYVNLLTNAGFDVFSEADAPIIESGLSVDSVSAGQVVLAADPSETIKEGMMVCFCDDGNTAPWYGTAVSAYPVIEITGQTDFQVSNDGIDTGATNAWICGPGAYNGSDGPDGWQVDTGVTVVRQQITLTDNAFYGLYVIPTSQNDDLRWPDNEEFEKTWVRQWQGKQVTFGAWIKSSTASDVRLQLYDGVGSNYSSYHTGGGGWEWLESTATVNSNAAGFACLVINVNASPGPYYIVHPMLVEGNEIGAGNWTRRQDETIWLDEDDANTHFVDYSNTTVASGNYTDVNIAEQTWGRLPVTARTLILNFRGYSNAQKRIRMGITNNAWSFETVTGDLNHYEFIVGFVTLDELAQFDFNTNDTFSGFYFIPKGVVISGY